MSTTRRFICCAPVSSSDPFEKDIPASLVERSTYLKLAVSEANYDDDSPVQLVLPSEIDSACLDSWFAIHLSQSGGSPSHLDSHQNERMPPEILLQALRVRSALIHACSWTLP